MLTKEWTSSFPFLTSSVVKCADYQTKMFEQYANIHFGCRQWKLEAELEEYSVYLVSFCIAWLFVISFYKDRTIVENFGNFIGIIGLSIYYFYFPPTATILNALVLILMELPTSISPIFHISSSLLLYLRPDFLPLYISLLINSTGYSNSSWVWRNYTLALFLMSWLIFAVIAFPTNTISLTLTEVSNSFWESYNSNVAFNTVQWGVFWYFRTLLLDEYYRFFQILLPIIIILLSLLLPSILTIPGSKPNHYEIVAMMTLIIQFFAASPDIPLISLVCGKLLFERVEICRKIRGLSFVLAGVLLILMVSPIMYELWVLRGTGNANYLFFPQYALWICLGWFISEYILAHQKYYYPHWFPSSQKQVQNINENKK